MQICRKDELNEGQTFCFTHQEQAFFLVRKHDKIYCYLNSCPHRGIRLDWVENELLDMEGELIQCATHGALFEIDNGNCVYGPCQGDALTSVEIKITEEWIEI